MFVVGGFNDGGVEALGRFPADYIMHAVEEAPSFPSGEQSGDSVGQAVLEGGDDNAAGAARHTLHVAQDERRGDAVRLACTATCHDDGGVCKVLGRMR